MKGTPTYFDYSNPLLASIHGHLLLKGYQPQTKQAIYVKTGCRAIKLQVRARMEDVTSVLSKQDNQTITAYLQEQLIIFESQQTQEGSLHLARLLDSPLTLGTQQRLLANTIHQLVGRLSVELNTTSCRVLVVCGVPLIQVKKNNYVIIKEQFQEKQRLLRKLVRSCRALRIVLLRQPLLNSYSFQVRKSRELIRPRSRQKSRQKRESPCRKSVRLMPDILEIKSRRRVIEID